MTNSWLRVRHELYRRLRKRVEDHLAQGGMSTDRELQSYHRDYELESRGVWGESSQSEFFRIAITAKVLLLGDFHALEQSQKTHIRILRKLIRYGKKPVLFLECFRVQDDPAIASFVRGDFSEDEFLKRISWDRNWGFPWQHYRVYLDIARKFQIEIRGLSPDNASALPLHERDTFAARVIGPVVENFTEGTSQAVVVMGDLHIARRHLPKILKSKLDKNCRVISVLQNLENLYWSLHKVGRDPNGKILMQDNQRFCILSVPPWIKWQSYHLILDHQGDEEVDQVNDISDQVASYVEMFNRDFGTTVGLAKLSVYNLDDRSLSRKIDSSHSKMEARLIKKMIEEEISFYSPFAGVAFLARASVNHAAALAMQYFYFELSGSEKVPISMPNDFERSIWLNAIEYFGSKLINPHRKTETLNDLHKYLDQPPHDRALEPAQVALAQKLREWKFLTQDILESKLRFEPKSKWSYYIAAKYLGGIVGEKMFLAFKEQVLSLQELRILLHQSLEEKDFNKFYYKSLKMFESLPEPFRSKDDGI